MENLSIVITTYNSEKNIVNLLEHLNSYNIKTNIIISDDASTDKTTELINKWKKEKSTNLNIEIYINKKNLGLSSNRKESVHHIKTKYMMFCDDDDYLDLFQVKKEFKNMKDNDILILPRYECENDKLLRINIKSSNPKKYFRYSLWAMWGIIFSREAISKINNVSRADLGEDINSFIILSNNKFLVSKSNKPCYIYIKAKSRMTGNSKEYSFDDIYSIWKNIKNTLRSSNEKYKEYMAINFICRNSFILKSDKVKHEINEDLINKYRMVDNYIQFYNTKKEFKLRFISRKWKLVKYLLLCKYIKMKSTKKMSNKIKHKIEYFI